MSTLTRKLGDHLKDREFPCKVKGCTNTWAWRASDQLRSFSSAGGTEPPARMCDACYELFNSLADEAVPCSRPGCEGSWTWTRGSQLHSRVARKRDKPPNRLCESCANERQEIADQEIPCRTRGCQGNWLWTAKAQLLASPSAGRGKNEGQVPKPPRRMCDACYGIYKSLAPEERPCRIQGCERTWTYAVNLQLQNQVQKRKRPPSRMCDPCYAKLHELEDKDVPCRIAECDRTWRWPRETRLRAWIQGQEDAPPERMCPPCSERFSQLADQEVPCSIPGCSGTWTDRRGSQLSRLRTRETKGDAAPSRGQRLCRDCRELLRTFEDKAIPCKNEGCEKTWLWKRGTQLRAQRAGDGDLPPSRTCPSCDAFVKSHPATQLICESCGGGIPWSTANQLKTHLGQWREPKRCGSCQGKALTARGPGPS